MPYCDVNDGRLYYETLGPKPGAAPAIVFAHGAGGNHLSWWQQVPHFAGRYACVTFDHRGFGLSASQATSPGAHFVEDLRALLDHLGIARATLVAQSMGGWTCLGLAVRHPERVERLMMCATTGGLRSPEIDEVIAAAWRTLPAPGEVHPAAGARMAREQPALHFLYQEIAGLSDVSSNMAGRAPAILREAGSHELDDVRGLPMQVLFLAGEEDIVIPPQALELAAAAIAGARYVTVPAAGHSVYFERAAAFNAILEEFLSAG
jgi:pimeloyl-ACP methyl ester carboxylesterase